MDRERSVYITYSSPASKRRLARVIFWVSVVIVALLIWSIASNYGKRKAKGYDPLPVSSLVPLGAPLMLIGIGRWIGWSQVRIDFRRGMVERRPLGLPFLERARPVAEARRLYVGFHRAPTAIGAGNASVMTNLGKGKPFWYVRIDGEGYQFMLIVQRARDEAVAFAQGLADKFGLPIEVAEEP